MNELYSPVVTELPKGFVPYQQWPEYDAAKNFPSLFRARTVHTGLFGTQWSFGPLVFEEYVSDHEPACLKERTRIVCWQRITRCDIPRGWHRMGAKPMRIEGFADLAHGYSPQNWNETARRYRNIWFARHHNKTHVIERISYSDFEEAYRRSTVARKKGMSLLIPLKRKVPEHQEHIECVVARELASGSIRAGAAFINSPTYNGSYYAAGFITEEAKRLPAMIGILSNWFEESHKKSIRFLHFGAFWQPGDPKDWKGFSFFKSIFGLQYLIYPPLLVRFVRGNQIV